MAEHLIRGGLSLPISGEPSAHIARGPRVGSVAILGQDYPNMKPRMLVDEGDSVKRGQALFEDRKSEGVLFTAPGAGTVRAIHRGEKRKFLSLVIDLSDSERDGDPAASDHASLTSYSGQSVSAMSGDDVRALMAESGLWTGLRQRPFDSVPSPSTSCSAVFVTATDTNPLAGSPAVICKGQEEALHDGLAAISKITSGSTYLCVGPDWDIDVSKVAGLNVETFSGPHPAGLPGTHIHTLRAASRSHTVFHIGVQDVIALGHLVKTGRLYVERIVAVSGPAIREAKLLRTRLGACTANLTEGRVASGDGEVRLVSGSVLHGATAQCKELGFLGRYSNQVTALFEDRERVFMGWLMPGANKFSTLRAHLSAWLPGKKFPLTTTTHGGHRAMVPIGMFERVMPLDILPTFLLRALVVGDVENAEALGCLELAEEDLALCSFVAPGKEDFGKALRGVLTDIWQEG